MSLFFQTNIFFGKNENSEKFLLKKKIQNQKVPKHIFSWKKTSSSKYLKKLFFEKNVLKKILFDKTVYYKKNHKHFSKKLKKKF